VTAGPNEVSAEDEEKGRGMLANGDAEKRPGPE
jgi:hypothetical protein